MLINYLFEIGDRHYDNILINEEGIIFHIDFGFIMGERSDGIKWNYKLVEPIIKNKKEPKRDQDYNKLIEITFKNFEIIRKYVDDQKI